MAPQTATFPTILKEMPKASLHPFCLEAFDKNADMHARHFSSPYSGTIEDITTGTASGVMGAYHATYIEQQGQSEKTLIVEQGQELEKDGRVQVHVKNDNGKLTISITGTAVFVKEIDIPLK